jgi:hypothetical protein
MHWFSIGSSRQLFKQRFGTARAGIADGCSRVPGWCLYMGCWEFALRVT